MLPARVHGHIPAFRYVAKAKVDSECALSRYHAEGDEGGHSGCPPHLFAWHTLRVRQKLRRVLYNGTPLEERHTEVFDNIVSTIIVPTMKEKLSCDAKM
jgi:hypothetical protein